MNNIEAIIRDRRSVRKYKQAGVPKSKIIRLLDAARWAPSGHNQQPWRFIVVEGDLKTKLVAAIKNYPKKEILLVRIILKEAVDIIQKAPVAIVVYQHRELSKRSKRIGEIYYKNASLQEVQSVSCAVQNMLLVAPTLGLGAVWLGILVYCQKQINRLLKTNDELMGVVTIGYPNENPKPRLRKPVSKIAIFKK